MSGISKAYPLNNCHPLFTNIDKQLYALAQPIKVLKLSTQTQNILEKANISHLVNLATKTKQDLLNIPYIGKTRLTEFEKALEKKDLQLGMKINVNTGQLSSLLTKLKPEIDIFLLMQPIDNLGFSTQVWFALKNEGIKHLGELVLQSKEQLLSPYLGKEELIEIEEVLLRKKLNLGMEIGINPEQLQTLIKILTDKTQLDKAFLAQPIESLGFHRKHRKLYIKQIYCMLERFLKKQGKSF